MCIDFKKRKFIKAFAKLSKEYGGGDPETDWFMIIANHATLTPEENLARLVWKGIISQTEEYGRLVDENL